MFALEIALAKRQPKARPRLNLSMEQVEERLHEAICTLAALPDRERRWIYAPQAAWPEPLREAVDLMAIALERVAKGESAYEIMPSPKYTPTKEAIDRMDETLEWLSWLNGRDLGIVTLRALGVSWVKIGWRLNVSDNTAKNWHYAAVGIVQGHLRNGDAPVIRPRESDVRATRHLRRMAQRMFR